MQRPTGRKQHMPSGLWWRYHAENNEMRVYADNKSFDILYRFYEITEMLSFLEGYAEGKKSVDKAVPSK